MSVLSHPKHGFVKGSAANPLGRPRGKNVLGWLEDIFDERVVVQPAEGPPVKKTRRELFARWIAGVYANRDESDAIRTTAMRLIMDRVAPVSAGGITLPDIKIVIVQDSPQPAMIDVKVAPALPGDGNGKCKSNP